MTPQIFVLSRMGFLSHNFGSRYASKPIKDSKDMDCNLVSKKSWAKKWLIELDHRARYTSPKRWKHAPLWHHPQRTPNQKQKKFSSIWTRRLADSADGLNASLTQPTGKLWRRKAWWRKWLAWDLGGWKIFAQDSSYNLLLITPLLNLQRQN